MNDPRQVVAGIATSPQAAQAMKEGKALAGQLGWESPELPAEEIPVLMDPLMEPGDVALYGPEQWKRRLLALLERKGILRPEL